MTHKRIQPSTSRRASRGFNLIELLVGIVLALIAVIVVMQVFQLNERRQRTGTGGDTAVMDGAIAITDLQRELRQGGMGMVNLALLGCKLALPSGPTLTALAPVTINPATSVIPKGDTGTDTLLIMYSNGNSAPEGNRVQAQPSTTTYNVNTPTSFLANDYVVAGQATTQPTPCNLVLDRITDVSGTGPGGTVTTSAGTAGAAEALFDWGQAPRLIAFRVSGGKLWQCDYLQVDCSKTTDGIWTELLDGVVNLRAQYGRDMSTPMDGQLDQYNQVAPTTNCGWARISAVRLAITMRNGQLEKDDVTGDTSKGQAAWPTWSGSTASGNDAAAPIDVTGLTNATRYRYRVFETVAPLRNMAWIGAQSTCSSITN